MRFASVLVVSLAATFFSSGAATPSDCYSSGRSYGYSYYTPYYQTYYTPYLTFSAPASDQGATIQALAAALLSQTAATSKAKDEQIEMLKAFIASGGVPPDLKAMTKPAHPGLALIYDSCMKCHNARDKARDGDGKIMWDGDVFVGTREQLEKCRDRIENGTMPPKSTWTDKEKMLGLSGLTRMKIGEPTAKADPKIKETPK